MSIQVIRDMGRAVPPEAQDCDSDNYREWLAGVQREQDWLERSCRVRQPQQTVIVHRPMSKGRHDKVRVSSIIVNVDKTKPSRGENATGIDNWGDSLRMAWDNNYAPWLSDGKDNSDE